MEPPTCVDRLETMQVVLAQLGWRSQALEDGPEAKSSNSAKGDPSLFSSHNASVSDFP